MLINNFKKESREKRHRSLRKRIDGHRRAPAPGGLPQRAAHLRPGHRRRRRARRWSARLDPRLEGAPRTLEGDKKTTPPRRSARRSPRSCLEKGIDKVVFDRNGYLYHGRVSALADAAREAGLKF